MKFDIYSNFTLSVFIISFKKYLRLVLILYSSLSTKYKKIKIFAKDYEIINKDLINEAIAFINIY